MLASQTFLLTLLQPLLLLGLPDGLHRTPPMGWSSLDYPARALRALGLLLADGAPTVGGGKTF